LNVYVVFQWSINPEDQDRCEAQLAEIAEHIRGEHPQIIETRLFKQWAGPQPRRGYTWMEAYESLTKIDEAEMTPACLEVWKPVEQLAQAGTFHTSVWFDGPEPAQLKR
jgi:hypothetical protein